jgi:hypothetical protein
MPRALEPGVKRFVVLPYDRAKPEAEQPRFFYAAQNLHKSAKIARLMDETQKAKDSEAVHESVIRSLQEIIIGWENLVDPETGKQIPFSADKIPEVLTMADANELIGEVFKSNVVEPDDQKKSA